jgi:hypothetical protein
MTARQRLVPPGSYRLYGQTIEVEYSDPGDWSSNGMGRANCYTNRIQLREGMGDDITLETFIHEVIHIIADKHHLGCASDETIINTLSVGLISFFRDNQRKAARWFQK